MLDWRPHFPLGKPRTAQARVLDKIVNALMCGKKTIIVDAPTGIGKSAIAVTLSRWWKANEDALITDEERNGNVHGTYIATSQKILQDQYVNDFPELVDLRSSTNYECTAIRSSCSEGLRIERIMGGKLPVSCAGSCPYRAKKFEAVNSNVVLSNYSYLMSESYYAGGLKPRCLLVCDEAHVIEENVRSWASVHVNDHIIRQLGMTSPGKLTEKETYDWVVGDYHATLMKKKADIDTRIKKIVDSNDNSVQARENLKRLSETYDEYDKRLCQVNRIMNEGLDMKNMENYVSSCDERNGEFSYSVRPVRVFSAAHAALYRLGTRKVLMSATIIDKKVFCRANGIPPKEVVYITEKSPFKSTAYGIEYFPIARMSKAARSDEVITRMRSAIEHILDAHPDDKGIIFSSSYELTRSLDGLSDRLIVQKDSSDRTWMIEKHRTSNKPTVLVSPSMTEGVDLYDDLSRFQVVCKVPYPYLGDAVVKKLMEVDKEWYAWATTRTIVQSMGRSVRHENDWTMTYVLDECFMDLYSRWKRFFPPHIRQTLDKPR